MSIRKKIITGLLVILAIGLIYFGNLFVSGLSRLGELSRIFPRFDGTYTEIALNAPAEDLLEINGKIYFSQAADNGGIGVFDPINQSIKYSDFKFKSQGLSKFNDLIYAVNKTNSGIEVFDTNLNHIKAFNIKDKNINDIEVINENSFYFSEDTKLNYNFSNLLKIILYDNDNSGAVFLYDNGKISKQFDNIKFANSLALSNDKSKLYVTSTMDQSVLILNRGTDNSLKLDQKIDIGTGLDNINIDKDGIIWIGAYPKILSTFNYNGKSKAPASQIIILEPNKDGKGGLVDQAYLKQDNFGASSVGLKYQNQLFIGSFIEKKLRVCELPKIWQQSKSHPASKLIDIDRDIAKKEAIKKARGF